MSLKLQYPTCRQLLADGRYCPCPALHGRSFCRHHTDERQRQRNFVKARQLKDYTQDRRIAAGQNVRPEEELNGAIFDSIAFPTLDSSAAICVAASNVARLLGAGHLSARAAAVMARLIRVAEVNLRQGRVFLSEYNTGQAQSPETDPVPLFGDGEVSHHAAAGSGLSGNRKPETGNPLNLAPPFGDEEGFVLPEESNLKRLHEEAKRELGADVANESRAEFGNMPAVIDQLDPKYAHLPPSERARAAYRDLKQLIAAQQQQEQHLRRGVNPPAAEDRNGRFCADSS